VKEQPGRGGLAFDDHNIRLHCSTAEKCDAAALEAAVSRGQTDRCIDDDLVSSKIRTNSIETAYTGWLAALGQLTRSYCVDRVAPIHSMQL